MQVTNKVVRKAFLALVLCSPLSASVAAGQVLFSDDFEGDANLPQWVGKSGITGLSEHSGRIVVDPLRPSNNVLTFEALISAGDVFGSEVTIEENTFYVLEFDYLGDPTKGGVPNDLGGTIGFSEDTPAGHRWLAGTQTGGGIEQDLLDDDNEWDSYSIEFNSSTSSQSGYSWPPTNNTIRVLLEDFVGSGGVAGDAYFDNIVLRQKLFPVANDDAFDASSNVPKVLNVVMNDESVAEIDFVTIVSGPTNGSLEPGDGEEVSSLNLIYTSEPDFEGDATFTYSFTNIYGDVSNVANVTIDVSATEAVVEPGVNQVFFNQANVPGSPNPLTASYQEVVVGGNASINCCRVLDTREGAGWRGRYRARLFDIGEATADLHTNPTCDVLLDEFGVPKIAPGTAILRASQRGIPESRGIGSDGTAREHDLGVCLLESEVESNGIFFAETNAANVLGFEVNCAARNVAWRPFTGFVTTGPAENIEVDYPFVTPGTAECDRARDGRRGSDNVIVLNLRRDTVFDRPQPFLQRLAINVQRSIQTVRNDMCVNEDFLDELSVRVAGAASDMRRPNNNFRVNRAVRRLDNATRLALLIPTIPGRRRHHAESL